LFIVLDFTPCEPNDEYACDREEAMKRRAFLRLAACAAALPAMPHVVRAQIWPSRPVRLVIGFGAGTAADIVARMIGQWLTERLEQPVIVEDRPGAGSNLAAQSVVRALPDGYTFLVVTTTNAINATLYDKLDFNLVRDIAPVAGLLLVPNLMVINPSVPARTIPEFIAYAKANPDKINMASTGNGTVPHVSGELFKMMAGINMVHVQYRGAPPALADLLSGQVQAYFASTTVSIEHVRAGKLRALAVTTAKRSEALPDVPTVDEFLPGYESSLWFGIGAPKNTRPEIIDKLNKEINAGLADPKIKALVADMGGAALAGSPADFGRLLADETGKWAKVVNFSGAKPD
jgi:tripartite-type tricarboxylate transporter receptor subunit TctC